MKNNVKNLTAIVLTLGVLTLSGCRETSKEGTHEDTHMDSNNGHMQNDANNMNHNENQMEEEK
ncbi:hypothetical protein [Yeosuana sp. AK3]